MLLKLILDTLPNPPCHVLILTPLSECLIVESSTVMLDTHARELRMPRLPMLKIMQRQSLCIQDLGKEKEERDRVDILLWA